jgi:hypothetical protein
MGFMHVCVVTRQFKRGEWGKRRVGEKESGRRGEWEKRGGGDRKKR